MKLVCPECGGNIEISGKLLGQRITCLKCGVSLLVGILGEEMILEKVD